MKVKGGILDKKAIDAAQAEALSKMPSKTEIQAGIVGLAMSPASNLIGQFGSAGKILSQIEKMIEGQGRLSPSQKTKTSKTTAQRGL